jgi:hypothetical protein
MVAIPRNTESTKTALERASSMYKRHTRPLVRKDAPQKRDRNCQRVINIWAWAPDVARHRDWLTDRQSLCDVDSSDSAVQCNAVERVGWWVIEIVRGLLRFSPFELLEAGSWGTVMIREPRVSRTSSVGSHYQTTTGENSAAWEEIVSAMVSVECVN